MPWHESDVMDQRCKFVVAYMNEQFTMRELCERFGISRPTGYKWVRRYRSEGVSGLRERSRAAHHCPHRMSDKVAQWLLAERRAHMRWGPRKLKVRFQLATSKEGPSRTAIADLLSRHGLIEGRRRRRKSTCKHRGQRARSDQPNELWTIDFKGQFYTGDHRLCYPLTLMDSASRYLLGCQAQPRIQGEEVRKCMRRLFQHYGLPRAIHSDNGPPFAGVGPTGLSRLSVYWLKLGIEIHRSRPGCPQDNGAHERMHRTLKAETARPPASSLRAQQCRFRRFQTEYNEERPHQALADRTPTQLYRPSARAFPKQIDPPDYPGDFRVRHVRTDGAIKWRGQFVFIAKPLRREYLGLQEVDDGIWSVWFMNYLLGRLDVRTMKLTHLAV
jgi:putative transposase